jgi:hypothetical protein
MIDSESNSLALIGQANVSPHVETMEPRIYQIPGLTSTGSALKTKHCQYSYMTLSPLLLLLYFRGSGVTWNRNPNMRAKHSE